MIYTSCILRKVTPNYNDYGARVDDTIVETEVPIIKHERIRESEFYRAGEQGLKPELRIVISSLNYNDEEELEYSGIIYTIIRIESGIDEMTIIAERKIKHAWH